MTRYQIIKKRIKKTDRARVENENIKNLKYSIEKHTFFYVQYSLIRFIKLIKRQLFHFAS